MQGVRGESRVSPLSPAATPELGQRSRGPQLCNAPRARGELGSADNRLCLAPCRPSWAPTGTGVATADQLALSWPGDRGELGSADDRLCRGWSAVFRRVDRHAHGEREDGQLVQLQLRTISMKSTLCQNRSKETASGPESSFSLTRQAKTNHYDRRIQWLATDLWSNRMQLQPASHVWPVRSSM
jgi:hypothetical protein